MKLRFEIEVSKVEGPNQDRDEVINVLTEQIEAIGSFWVQDGDHEKETEYRVGEVLVWNSETA